MIRQNNNAPFSQRQLRVGELIKQSLSSNEAKKIIFNDNFSYSINENEFTT